MIVTLTANPSLDRTVEVAELRPGTVMRAVARQVHPGGKGLNVTRALAAHGIDSRAVLPVGGPEGAHLTALLDGRGVRLEPVAIRESIRCNITVAEPDGTTTKFNEPGPELSGAELDRLVERTLACAAGAAWVVAAGSLPPGAPDGFYGGLVRRLAALPRPVPVAVDTSGPALLEAAGAGPSLLKPNREELETAAGRPLATLGDVVKAAEELRARGVGAVLASLGSDGAVLVGADGVWHAEAPARRRSSVGAGDALLAGFLAAGAAGAAALAAAVAWGAAAVSLPGSRMPAPDDVRTDLVRVHDAIDTERTLAPD
ncbi:1-phosphofructokinase [Allonocardiopsis opalescens]|uniref:1-phosphofructokinase n=1 Tax=Allonocardiopsis opalescens TaxID=1144618 RepID=A0A2T0QE81_9ACTN|nr:1-phosphofructokinase [Allonocardiopsis opalescens]PRY02247.1 1-phosphofructokinase [Allonocardiopsis opalescens]